jgi:peptide deformylase
MKLKLITVPNPLLRQKSLPIEKLDQTALAFIHNLGETLVHTNNPPGVGLSAVQVGQLLRVFCTYLPPDYRLESLKDDDDPQELKVFINPKIVAKSKEMTLGNDPDQPALEGCLSVPALYGPVPRHQQVTVAYQTLENEQIVEKTDVFENFYARVIQHEYDHLDGILFTDYTKKDHQNLYFDQGKHLVQIESPEKLIQW